MRSLPLIELLESIKEDALVINLQYNASPEEIRAAQIVHTDLEIFVDREVDQMTDLNGFASQIAALDDVVTIDNTTAHFCVHLVMRVPMCLFPWAQNACGIGAGRVRLILGMAILICTARPGCAIGAGQLILCLPFCVEKTVIASTLDTLH